MRKRRLAKLCFGSLIVGSLALAGCRTTVEQRAERFTSHVVDDLEMDEEQTKNLKESVDRIMAKRNEFKGIRVSLSDEMIYQLQQDKIDQERLDKTIQEKEEKMNEAIQLMKDEFVALHKNLTPEQRVKVIAHIEKSKEKSHWRRHHW